MTQLVNKQNIKKKYIDPKAKTIEEVFKTSFSLSFYNNIVKAGLENYSISIPEDIKKVIEYVSEDGSHVFVSLFVKRSKPITESTIEKFTVKMKQIMQQKGYHGKVRLVKHREFAGKSRRVAELPLVWKSKTTPGTYVFFFERFK